MSPFLDLSLNAASLWRRCPVHDMARDPDSRVCDGCAADARPACMCCMGTGTTSHFDGSGLEWPERCRCRAPRDPWRPDRGEYAA